MIDLNEPNLCKFIKIKNKTNILSYIGFSKKNNERSYLCFFDEAYIYFVKDIEVDKNNKNLRKVGNKYNLKYIQNAILEVKINHKNIRN